MSDKQLTDKQKANCWDYMKFMCSQELESNSSLKDYIRMVSEIEVLFSTGVKLESIIDMISSQYFNKKIDNIMKDDNNGKK